MKFISFILILFISELFKCEIIQQKFFSGKRPSNPLFVSDSVEKKIKEVTKVMKNKKLAEIFSISYPNTLDTTVKDFNEKEPNSYVITGDIDAMWLRDSTNQVIQYIDFINEDKKLKQMIKGVINQQKKFIIIDPYANAFNFHPKNSPWVSDRSTKPNPEKGKPRIDVMNSEQGKYIWERKYEVDSLAAFLKLSAVYIETSNDYSIIDNKWLDAYELIIKTFEENQIGLEDQDKNNYIPYTFVRSSSVQTESLRNGRIAPGNTCGLIGSGFRPSDDACTYPYLIPSNAMASVYLNKTGYILERILKLQNSKDFDIERAQFLAKKGKNLSEVVRRAIFEHGITQDKKGNDIIAYEVDCKGNYLKMDDANVPSLLSLPYLEFLDASNPLYINTRNFILSSENPQFFKGKFEGIGSPHTYNGYIWHMSIIMRAMTSKNDTEIIQQLDQLTESTCNTGFMHEGFSSQGDCQFTRSWFAWANSILGQLVLQLYQNKPYLLIE